MTKSRCLAAMVLVVLLSLVVPAGIVVWSCRAAFTGKEFGLPGAELNEIRGSLKNRELWFSVGRWTQTQPRLLIGCQIKRLNLETGELRDAQIQPAKVFLQPFWLGDTLYAFSQRTLYVCVGSQFEELALLPPRVPPYFFTWPFLHDGKISTIINPSKDEFRMVHLVEGEWIDGPQIQLPNLPYVKHANSPTSFGIQPAPMQSPVKTGLADGNAPETVVSDTPIQPSFIDDRTSYELRFGPDGAYYVSIGFPIVVARQLADGSWKKLVGDYGRKNHHGHHPFILADPSEPLVYLVEAEPWGAYADFYRVEGDAVLPSHLHWSGGIPMYLRRWYQLSIGLVLAWLLHLTVLMVGVQWFARNNHKSNFVSGILQATNAPVWRRVLAGVTDLAIAVVIPSLLVLIQLPYFGVQRHPMNEGLLFDVLFQMERIIPRALERGPSLQAMRMSLGGVLEVISTIVEAMFDPPLPRNPVFFLLIIAEILCLATLKVLIEGRSGMTIGKWFLGIRTVRSTLRPCGFARSLIRNVLYWVDLPLLITPFPAAMCMLCTQQNQRLGDRVADTVVVRARSIHTAAVDRAPQ